MNDFHFFFSSLFFADSELLSPLMDGESSFNYWEQFVHMLVTLGLLLAVIFVTVWFLKRFMASRNRLLNRSTAIQILEKRTLSQKSFLYLVQVDGKKILISDSPTGPSFLCEIKAKEENREEMEEELPQIIPETLKNKVKRFFVKNG